MLGWLFGTPGMISSGAGGGGGSGDMLSTNNLSDVANVATARANLGLTIGTHVQAYDADLTTWAGITPGANVATFLATPSSANLAAVITDETGTGALVFGTSPTFTTNITTPKIIGGTSAGAGIEFVPTTGSASGNSFSWFIGTNGATRAMTLFGDGNVTIGTSATSTAQLHTYKDNTDTSPCMTIEQDGAGDAQLQFLLTGTRAWVMGIDNSVSDVFRIVPANDGFATTTGIQIQTDGAVSIPAGGLNVGSVTLWGAGGAFRSGTTAANNIAIAAYDVDGAAYKNFITLTSNNTPSCVISQPSGGTLTITAVDANTAIVDDSDATKAWAVQCSGITTATTRTSTIPDSSGVLTHRRAGVFDADLSATATIDWDGTDPTGGTLRYSWQQIGGWCFFSMRGDYTGAGTTNTTLTITRPSDMPTPADFTGTAASEPVHACAGQGYTSITGNGSAAKAVIQKNAGNTDFEFCLKGMTSGSMVGFVIAGSYPVASASRL